jgi:hypothetical protein
MINYRIPVSINTSQGGALSSVILKVYDMLGREVAVLVNSSQKPGFYEVYFDGSKLSSGVYIYRLTANPVDSGKLFVKSAKMTLIK